MPQIKNSWFVALLICILFPTIFPTQYCYFGWDLIYKLYKQNAQKLSNKNAQFIGNRIIQVLHSGGGTCVNKYQEQEKEKQKKQNKSR